MAFRIYRHYQFTDKDPVIGKIEELVSKEKLSQRDAALVGGVAPKTLTNWFTGPTRRPNFASIMSVTRGLGWDIEFHKSREMNFEKEIKAAIEESKKKPMSARSLKRLNRREARLK